MAGSWSNIEKRGEGSYAGHQNAMFAVASTFTADAAAATVPSLAITDMSPAFLADMSVIFDGTTPPDSATIVITDIDGATVYTETAIAATGRFVIDDRPSLIGGCNIAVSGNTTNSAKAKIVLNFASNRR